MQLNFTWDKTQRIFKISFYFLAGIYCLIVGTIPTTWYLSAFFYLFAITFFIFMFVNEIINRRVQLNENILILSFLNKKKEINLEKVLWYSKNMEFDEIADSKFCKSNKNIILFYEGRKEFISVEEVELIENILVQHGIPQSVEENKTENKLKLFTPTIFAICLNGVNVFLRRFEGSLNKSLAFNFAMAICVVCLIMCIIDVKRICRKKK
ncbi:MAG: hypothetical protein E7060_02130 [Treponema bryantii]|nr:hypothetical protein [Treponema bryantii]